MSVIVLYTMSDFTAPDVVSDTGVLISLTVYGNVAHTPHTAQMT